MKIIKKLFKSSLVLCMLLSSNIPVSANNNFIVLDNFKVKYHNVIYDLSKKEDNIKITQNNENMTVEEYLNILDVVIESNSDLLNNNENNTRALVPSEPGAGSPYRYHLSMEWFYRSEDGWNLGVIPYDFPRQNFNNAVIGWNEVVDEQGTNAHWYNEASLRGQYLCHFWFANTKEQWNIAPSIPNKNAFEWIGHKCN